MSDLTPRGPYKEQIKPWNILDGFPPVERAPDYVIIDPPYLGACREQYSRRPDDLANMDEAAWTEAMHAPPSPVPRWERSAAPSSCPRS